MPVFIPTMDMHALASAPVGHVKGGDTAVFLVYVRFFLEFGIIHRRGLVTAQVHV